MADAIVSDVAKRLVDTAIGLIREEVDLVRNVEKEIINLSDKLKVVGDVLEDAEKKGFKDDNVRKWLNRLTATCYEMDDVLDEWDYHLLKRQIEYAPNLKVCSFLPSSSSSCFCFKKVFTHRRVAKKIIEAKEKLEKVLEDKKLYDLVDSKPTNHVDGLGRDPSTSFVDVRDICGRHRDKETLLRKFLGNNDGTSEEEHLHIQVISVVGVGGIGKTTLAQLVFNDFGVERHYPLRIWICVSNPFDQFGITKGIIQKITNNSPDANQLNLLLEHLKTAVMGKKFLLVLDDVWTEEHSKWEPLKDCLKFGGKGSKILVTTRNVNVAKMIGTLQNDIHHVGLLSNDDCWLLLSRMALFDRSEKDRDKFKEIGKEIAGKCKGLPLAAKILGSLLRCKTSLADWEKVAKSEMWELEQTKKSIFPHLILSYNELSPTLRRCFSYCGIFPEDFVIDVDFLISNWAALGYLGSGEGTTTRGREYFNNLAMYSLFHEFVHDDFEKHVIGRCKMHDIVRDFARFIRNDTSHDVDSAGCRVCSSTRDLEVKEYRSVHCIQDSPPKDICECWTGVRVLNVDAVYRLERIPRGIEKLIHLRELDLNDVQVIAAEDLKAICKLYMLKILLVRFCNVQELPKEIGNLTRLEHLELSNNEDLKELPNEIGNLTRLQYLNLSRNRILKELPKEIGKLTRLEQLELSGNENVKELPKEIGNLTRLERLDLSMNINLLELPETMCFWNELRYFNISRCWRLSKLPEGIQNLTNLETVLGEFKGKLGYLKRLNQLRGGLKLRIPEFDGTEDDVREARKAEMNKKVCLRRLTMNFSLVGEEGDKKWDWMDALDALEPHRNLSYLEIRHYGGSKLPNWVSSPVNQVRKICFKGLPKLSSLAPLGKLPCLEVLTISYAHELKFVGREFLGITTRSGNATDAQQSSLSSSPMVTDVAFPMLKKLEFEEFGEWKEWEDITIEEEASRVLSLFPALQELTVSRCPQLRELPHRLLHSASSLETLMIRDSLRLEQHYDKNKEGCGWTSISCIPNVYI